MTDFKPQHKSLDTHTVEIRCNNKTEAELEQKLIYLIKYIKTQMDALMDRLVHSGEQGELAIQIVNLIHVVETVQAHFEFNLALLNAKCKEEVEELKRKITSTTKLYDVVNSKEDLLQGPFNIILDFFKNSLCHQIEKIVDRCFEKHVNGDTLLLDTEENMAKIKIMINKLEILSEFFPKVYHFHKDEVICHDRSAPVWQDIYSCTTHKQILTKDEVTSSFKQFHLFMQISHAIIKNQIRGNPAPGFWSTMSLLKDIVYYSRQAAKAETQALLYLTKPTADYAFQAWKLTDHPMISKLISFRFPKIAYDGMIYLPRLFPAITKSLIFKEYANKTINKMQPMDHSYLTGHRVPKLVAEDIADILVDRPGKIPVRILGLEDLQLNNPTLRKPDSNIHQEEAIVIHVHGGGFVSMSSSSHRVYLNQWVKDLKMIHFSIDYRLAPENPYPAALDDVWQAYLWILNYASTVLGIKYKKIILAGESAGGNLVLALTLRILRAGLQPPDGVYSIYPALFLSDTYCNPSHLKAINDPVLNFNILRLCLTSYVPEDCETRLDPFISPVLVSDELLKNFPPTRFVVGSEDPLLDDSYRFVGKLRRNKRDVKITVHKHLSHGFMSHSDMKYYDKFLKEGSDTIQELVDCKTQASIVINNH